MHPQHWQNRASASARPCAGCCCSTQRVESGRETTCTSIASRQRSTRARTHDSRGPPEKTSSPRGKRRGWTASHQREGRRHSSSQGQPCVHPCRMVTRPPDVPVSVRVPAARHTHTHSSSKPAGQGGWQRQQEARVAQRPPKSVARPHHSGGVLVLRARTDERSLATRHQSQSTWGRISRINQIPVEARPRRRASPAHPRAGRKRRRGTISRKHTLHALRPRCTH